MKKCDYGCGNKARYQLGNGKWCCEEHYSKCPVLRNKNSKGLKKAYKEGRKKPHHKDHPKWGKAWNKGKTFFTDNRISSNIDKDLIFIKNSKANPFYLRKYVLMANLFEYKCKGCGINKWQGKELVLELDHINGCRTDNRPENLRWLCPNCHSQTPNFRGRNKASREKINEKDIIIAIKSSNNIREVLIKLKLAPKGGNYNTIKKAMQKYGLTF